MKLKLLGLLALPLLSAEAANREIIIDLASQRAFALENGQVVMESKVSTGRKSYETPTGAWRISQKEKAHKSTLYPKPKGGASMPYMMRLGSTAMAMHMGYVPDYPASHGCIRLPNGYAQKFYKWTRVGTRVKVVKHSSLGSFSLAQTPPAQTTFAEKRVAKNSAPLYRSSASQVLPEERIASQNFSFLGQ